MRKREDWIAIIKRERTDEKLARFILADLVGYRTHNLHQQADEASLRSLLEVVRELARTPESSR